MQTRGRFFREMKRRKAYEKTVRAQDPREGGSHPPRAAKAARKQAQREGLIPMPKKSGSPRPVGRRPGFEFSLGFLRSVQSARSGLLPSARQAQKNAFRVQTLPQARFQKRTMTVESLKTKPDKSPKTKAELEDLVLAELRAGLGLRRRRARHGRCLRRLSRRRHLGRWPVAIRVHPRRKTAKARLCDIVGRLQQHFDIAP